MDSDDTTDDISRNLMHQTSDKIHIGENAKVIQHDPDFENADYEDHIEAPHCPSHSVNSVKNNARIFQSKTVLEGYTRYWPHSSFAPLDSNCINNK